MTERVPENSKSFEDSNTEILSLIKSLASFQFLTLPKMLLFMPGK